MNLLATRLCLCLLLVGCFTGRTAEVPAPNWDAVGKWIAYGPHGVCFRLELDRGGTGYFTTQFEHTQSKEKPDVYRVNWKATKGFRAENVSFWRLEIQVAPVDPAAVPIKFRKVEFYGGMDA